MRHRRVLPSRRTALALPFAALALLGAGLAFEATPSSASPTCSFYASPNGSDAGSGTSSAPFATVDHLASVLAPGQTGCLAAGATFTGDVSLSHGGQAGAPIVLTSADPASPATIRGRITTFPGGDWITFTQLKLDGINPGALPSPTVGSDHVTFSNVDVTNDHTAICFDLINSNWGVAHYTTIDSSKIHGCGVLPSTNQDHGIYVSGYYATITNNYIYDNTDRGVQLRGSQNGTIQHNVIDRNGEGVIFGDQLTSNNDVSENIVSNSNIRWNAESFWGSGPVGTGNSFHDNCLWATNSESYYDNQGGVDGPDGFSASANTIGNPLYVNAGAGNYAIPSGSPCAGKGPLTNAIGVTAAPSTPPTTTAATTTAAVTTTPPATSTTTTSPGPTTTAPAGTTTTTSSSPPDAPRLSRGTAPTSAPTVSALPSIQGAPVVGSWLASTPGRWTAAGSASYSWLRCGASGAACVPIAGATASGYKLTTADRGSRIRVTVIAQNANGSTSATSAATAPVGAQHTH
jgi:parallel beta-helix repeat protein